MQFFHLFNSLLNSVDDTSAVGCLVYSSASGLWMILLIDVNADVTVGMPLCEGRPSGMVE